MAKGRISFSVPAYTSQILDWFNLVKKPFEEGRFVEAFGSADALIDDATETLLRHLYRDSQDLINEIHLLRGRVNFDGLVQIEILKSKTIVDQKFVDQIREFKKARNLVLHNAEAEYALIIGNPEFTYNSQEQLDKLVLSESSKWIASGFDLFQKLHKLTKIDPAHYFSEDFYRKNPRGKFAKKQFPKIKE